MKIVGTFSQKANKKKQTNIVQTIPNINPITLVLKISLSISKV
jgi:hypothetical protein